MGACGAFANAYCCRWREELRTRHFSINSFHKAENWWVLLRQHADIVAHDQELWETMERIDFANADEHYVVSLLTAWGQQAHMDCIGGTTFVDWHQGGAHPYAFTPENITETLLFDLRGTGKRPNLNWTPESCDFVSALAYSDSTKAPEEVQVYRRSAITQLDGGSCPLFARKFPADVSMAMYDIVQKNLHTKHVL